MLGVILCAGIAVGGCASASASAGSVDADVASASASASVASSAPPVFAASLVYMPTGLDQGSRVALFSSLTGHLVRWLAPLRLDVDDDVLSVRDGWVYFASESASPSVWRVAETGGPAQLVQAGASDYAISPNGADIAYVASTAHERVASIVVRNLATGKQNAIVMATDPCGCYNNWPPTINGLSWAPDDAHLAVTVASTAALSSVLVFDGLTAKTISDGRTAPAPCTVGAVPPCEEYDSGYLADGSLTYVVEQLSSRGTALNGLYAWRDGRITALLRSFNGGIPFMNPRGQAIWTLGPSAAHQPWAIWRWTGGAPVRILTLPLPGEAPYIEAGPAAW
jgi:hypothetical protein